MHIVIKPVLRIANVGRRNRSRHMAGKYGDFYAAQKWGFPKLFSVSASGA